MPQPVKYNLFEPVLVRGIGSEIGMALAHAVMSQGGRVLGLCRKPETLSRIRSAGCEGLVCENPEDLPHLLREHGFVPASFVDLAHSQTESLLAGLAPDKIDAWAYEDIALRARFLRSVVRLMLPARRGRCIFMSSSAAASPAKGQAFYAAAKLCAESLYNSAGLEMASHGITACSLRAGWLAAGRGRTFLSGRQEKYEQCIPTGRLVSLDEVVGTMLFLLSAEAASINATTVTVDGGFAMAKQGQA